MGLDLLSTGALTTQPPRKTCTNPNVFFLFIFFLFANVSFQTKKNPSWRTYRKPGSNRPTNQGTIGYLWTYFVDTKVIQGALFIVCISLYIYILYTVYTITGWWFGTFFIFHNIWDNSYHWRTHIFQDGYCTTNQYIYIYMCSIHNYIHLHTNKQGPARWSPHWEVGESNPHELRIDISSITRVYLVMFSTRFAKTVSLGLKYGKTTVYHDYIPYNVNSGFYETMVY